MGSDDLSDIFTRIRVVLMPPGFAPGGFDCGEEDLTGYLCDGNAAEDGSACFSTTYLVMDGDALVGYFSVLADSIRLQTKERPEGVRYSTAPAIKLGRMGVDRRYRGRNVGTWILDYVVGLARTMVREIGVRYVTLDALAKPSLVGWYRRYGFVENRGEKDRKEALKKFFRWPKRPSTETISMRYDVLLSDEVHGGPPEKP